MTGLTRYDKRHWNVVPQVIAYLNEKIPPNARVLEIGPGDLATRGPWQRADLYVDFTDIKSVPQDKLVLCDVTKELLPFPDKSFDFIYCRHVIEDLYNPFNILHEMSRVGKAGYIETPSPIAEFARGVDGEEVPYRGYHHHHFFVWDFCGELRLLSKYSVIEHAKTEESQILNMLRIGPKYWNTYYLWENEIKFSYRQNVTHFNMTRDYSMMLMKAFDESRKSIDDFWVKLPHQVDVKQLLPQIGVVPIAAA